MRLSYDDLVRDYLESLRSTLRNFTVEPEFLGTWVHDEDDHRSLFEVFVAAQGAGCRELTVAVGPALALKLKDARLISELGPLGQVRLEKIENGSLEITVLLKDKLDLGGPAPRPQPAAAKPSGLSAPGRPAEPKKVVDGPHPAYRAALESRKIRFEASEPAAPPDGVGLSVEQDGTRLAVSLDPGGTVVSARHSGATGPLRALLDGLCEVMEQRPLHEAHDHAVIRLETLMRDKTAPRPVTGVLTPRNADPIFETPQRMVRSLYAKYASLKKLKPEPNFWDDIPAEGWRSLPPPEKLARAKAAVLEACRSLKVSSEGIEVLDVIGDARLVLAYGPATGQISFGETMMRLEGLVKRRLDPRIELQLESLEDRNRRAARTDRDGKLI